MIKTLKQVREEIKYLSTESMIEEALKEWSSSIIDQCADVVMGTRPDTSTADITEVKDRIV